MVDSRCEEQCWCGYLGVGMGFCESGICCKCNVVRESWEVLIFVMIGSVVGLLFM